MSRHGQQREGKRPSTPARSQLDTAPTRPITPVRQPAARSRRRPLRVIGRMFVSILTVLVLLSTGIAWSMMDGLLGNMHTSDALGDGPRSLDGALNILLIGLDSRKDQDGEPLPDEILDKLHAGDETQGGYNANTLILMHIPPGEDIVTAVSIPRDDYVEVQGIPGYTHAKIKEAYGLAKYYTEQELREQGVTDPAELEQLGREAGRAKTIETVRNFLDVPIDRFAEVNLAGFYQLATALGGVEVCLNGPVNDPYSGANFPAGRQSLNGAQALAFVRQRHGLPNGDLDRTRRQQAFLASMGHKLRSAGTFTDLGKLQDLVDTATDNVVISSGWDLVSFAQRAQSLTDGAMEFSTLPIEGYDTIGGQEVNVVDVDKVRSAVRTAFGIEEPEPTPQAHASATIDVDNANGQDGLAAGVAEALDPHGFVTGELGNAPIQAASGVTYGEGAESDARTAADLLGGLPVTANPSLGVDRIRITLGTGFTLPSALDPDDAQSPPGTTEATPGAQAENPSSADSDPAPVLDGDGIPCVD